MMDFLKALVGRTKEIRIPIATKLVLGFLVIVAFISTVYMVVGVQLISNRIVSEAQDKVRHDLNTARELYFGRLEHINNLVRITSGRFFLRDALLSGNLDVANHELLRIKNKEGLDILNLTDASGNVILRTSYIDNVGDNQSHDELIKAVMKEKKPIASTTLVSGGDLNEESPLLAQKAYFKFIETPRARPRDEIVETDGMMLKAASPVFDSQNLVEPY